LSAGAGEWREPRNLGVGHPTSAIKLIYTFKEVVPDPPVSIIWDCTHSCRPQSGLLV